MNSNCVPDEAVNQDEHEDEHLMLETANISYEMFLPGAYTCTE